MQFFVFIFSIFSDFLKLELRLEIETESISRLTPTEHLSCESHCAKNEKRCKMRSVLAGEEFQEEDRVYIRIRKNDQTRKH